MKFKPKSEDGKNFLKLEEGKPVTGVFRGELHEQWVHWIKEGASSSRAACKRQTFAGCEHCKVGHKARFSFRLNFITKEKKEDGKEEYVAKILEKGRKIYDLLRDLQETLQETGYNLEQQTVKIIQTGEGLNTHCNIIAVPNGLLTPEKETIIGSISLLDLVQKEEEATEVNPPPGNYDEIPF